LAPDSNGRAGASDRLQLFIQDAPSAVAMFDRNMNYLAASSRWIRDHRFREPVLGRSHYDVLPDIPERWKEVHRRALAGEVIAKEEDRFDRADGTVQWLNWEVRPWHNACGEVGGIVISLEEISERKRAEEALRKSEERFRAVFENAGNGIAIANCDGRLREINPAFCKMLGYTREELVGRLAVDFVHPDDQAVNFRQFQRLQQGEAPALEFEHRFLRKDGEAIWVRKSASLLRDNAGRIEAILALVTDITERRRMEQALRNADRRKDEFVATLAHELRNPLAPIRNAVYILQRSDYDDAAGRDRARSLLPMMEKQVDHLVRLVDDLLEVSRITSGKIELQKEMCDVNAILRQAVDTSQPNIQRGGHRLTVELPSTPLPLDADPVRLAQVFANLLNNAAKYTEDGGHIWLKAERSGEQVAVSVRDNGIGILPEMLPRVFDLFSQSEHGRRRSQGGLGLGLALVRGLVQMHGGRVEARSDGRDRGSEFVVSLPLGAAVTSETNRTSGEEAVQHPSHRVLVVDDDYAVADSFAMLLAQLGMNVRIAYDGEAALSQVSSFKPHFAFIDIGMPGIDGYETARRVRMLPEGEHLFLAALTGWGQEKDRRRSVEAGFDRHFVKPIKIDALEDLLASTQSRTTGSVTATAVDNDIATTTWSKSRTT
jgi:PAS domain S-box-containing protein